MCCRQILSFGLVAPLDPLGFLRGPNAMEKYISYGSSLYILNFCIIKWPEFR